MWLSGQQVWTPGPGALPRTAKAWGCRPAPGPVPLHTPRTTAGDLMSGQGAHREESSTPAQLCTPPRGTHPHPLPGPALSCLYPLEGRDKQCRASRRHPLGLSLEGPGRRVGASCALPCPQGYPVAAWAGPRRARPWELG